jgi:hypothetical protein
MESAPAPENGPDRPHGVRPHGAKPLRTAPSWAVILVIVLILAGVFLTAFYGPRVVRSFQQMHHSPLRPGVTDVNLVRGWMTVAYVARAYRVPEEVLWQGLGIPREGNRFKSLRMLDREYAQDQPGRILTQVKTLIQQYQAEHPAPTPTTKPHSTVP